MCVRACVNYSKQRLTLNKISFMVSHYVFQVSSDGASCLVQRNLSNIKGDLNYGSYRVNFLNLDVILRL